MIANDRQCNLKSAIQVSKSNYDSSFGSRAIVQVGAARCIPVRRTERHEKFPLCMQALKRGARAGQDPGFSKAFYNFGIGRWPLGSPSRGHTTAGYLESSGLAFCRSGRFASLIPLVISWYNRLVPALSGFTLEIDFATLRHFQRLRSTAKY